MDDNSDLKLLLSVQLDVFKSRTLKMTYIRLSAVTPKAHKVNKTQKKGTTKGLELIFFYIRSVVVNVGQVQKNRPNQ